MKYGILITLFIIFIVWLLDGTPMTTYTTAYRAKCDGDLIAYDNCWGNKSTGEVIQFNGSSHLSQVYLLTENDLPKSLGECTIENRKNWHCTKTGHHGMVDFYWMTDGLYVHNTVGKETDIPDDKTMPVQRYEWVWLYISEIPSNLQKWLQQSKDQHFKKRAYEDAADSASVY